MEALNSGNKDALWCCCLTVNRWVALSRVTFSVSVESWMALGMSRAVFSFVMEQMSFSRTVSCGVSHTLR